MIMKLVGTSNVKANIVVEKGQNYYNGRVFFQNINSSEGCFPR